MIYAIMIPLGYVLVARLCYGLMKGLGLHEVSWSAAQTRDDRVLLALFWPFWVVIGGICLAITKGWWD